MAHNNQPNKPFALGDDAPTGKIGGGLAQSLITSRGGLPINRPNMGIASIPPPAPQTKPRPIIQAQSAPTASFIPPKPPSSRPNVPSAEPPAFDLPPSMPETGFLESKIAAMTVQEEGESDMSDEDDGINIPTGDGVIISKPSKPITQKPQQPSTMGRSLTNNTGFMMAMSLPQNTSIKGSSGSAELGLGRSPTILSIMSGLDDKLAASASATNNPPPISHSSRASITGAKLLPPMSAQPTFEDPDEDEYEFDEDEDEDDEGLQFNLTLGAK